MTWCLLLRRSYGVRLLPVMLIMWWYGAFGNPPAHSTIERASSTLYAFMMVAGPVALGTCLELRRFTEGQILKRLSKRSRLRIVAPWWAIAVLPSAMAVGVSVLLSGSGDKIVRMSLIGVVWMLAWGVFGAVIGASWPLALAAPTALGVPFVLVLYGPAVSVLELRYLVGYYMSCCNVGEMLDPRVLVAGMTMACGVLVVSMMALIAGRERRHPNAIVTVVLIIGLVSTVLIGFREVEGVGALPAVPRTGTQTCLKDPTVCTWGPQDLQLLGPIVQKADAAWRASGIHVPSEYRQGTGQSTQTTVWWSASAENASGSAGPTLSAVADGMAVAPCQARKDQVEIWVEDVQERVVAWLVEHSGIEARDATLSPETREWLKSIDRLPIEKQASIIEQDRARLRTC